MVKKYFIPNESNNYKPHILRNGATLFFLIMIFLIEGFFLAQTAIFPKTALLAEIFQSVLIEKTNATRQAENIGVLKENFLLEAAAKMKAEDMASKGYFAHTSPIGTEPWHWVEKAGYDYLYAGENLAINFSDSQDVMDAWLNSPGHRQNILNDDFTEIGIGTAEGLYDGKETIFIVQMFGTPNKFAAAAQPQALPKASEPIVEKESIVESPPSNAPNEAAVLAGEIIASPRQTSNYVYVFLAVLILFALILNIVVRIKIQRSRVILNGVVLLVIINTVIFLNQYFALADAAVF